MGPFTEGTWSVTNGILLRISATLPGESSRPLTLAGVHQLGKFGGRVNGDPLANAHLMAAGPDMLRALKLIKQKGLTVETGHLMDKAIAKAQPTDNISCKHVWDYTSYGRSCKLCELYEDV